MAVTTALGGFGDGSGPGAGSEVGEEFLARLAARARKLGKGLVEKALIAYYVGRDPATPMWARTSLVGALVYLGLPLDAVPDVVPVVGLTDDAAAIGLALFSVAASIRWRHVREAREAMRAWGFKVSDIDARCDPEAPADGFDH